MTVTRIKETERNLYKTYTGSIKVWKSNFCIYRTAIYSVVHDITGGSTLTVNKTLRNDDDIFTNTFKILTY